MAFIEVKTFENSKNNCNLPDDFINDIVTYSNVSRRILEYFTDGPLKGKTWSR